MDRLRPITASVCLGAYVLFSAAGLSNVVLCIGADGHLAFEMAVDGCCQDEASGGSAQREAAILGAPQAAADEHCGACLDISLASTQDDQEQPQTSRPLPDQAVASSALQPTRPITTAPPQHDKALRPSPQLRALRTVILLS